MPDDGAATWPSIAEMAGSPGNREIPEDLLKIVRERYVAHSPEYVSDEIHHNGKPYNKCMFSDSLQECEEEIVDAVFNAMIYNTRAELGATWLSNPTLIEKLIEVWELLKRLKGLEPRR